MPWTRVQRSMNQVLPISEVNFPWRTRLTRRCLPCKVRSTTPFDKGWERTAAELRILKQSAAQAQVVWMMKSFQDVTFLFGEASLRSWCVGYTVEKSETYIALLDLMQLTNLLFLEKIWNTHLATWSFNDSYWTWVKRTSSCFNSIFVSTYLAKQKTH